MKAQISSDFGLFVCGQCGRFLKLEDLPCACGNDGQLKKISLTPARRGDMADFRGGHEVPKETGVYTT